MNITLRNGKRMPAIGLGTYKTRGYDKVRDSLAAAFSAGYKLIDTAAVYRNEEDIARAIKELGIDRKELFITSKLAPKDQGTENARRAIEESLNKLNTDYLDLYLIHFPISLAFVPFETRYPPEWFHDPSAPNPKMELVDVPVRETWEAMEKLVDSGKVRHIGVSNFSTQSIRDLVSYARIKPTCLQVIKFQT